MENKKADEQFDQIINDSKKKLIDMQILSNFFNHGQLIAIFIRTKVIHSLFEGNKSLDINKLELFHIQYTVSLIDLFKKLKKSKEQNYLLIQEEININNDFIRKLKEEVEHGLQPFLDDVKTHGRAMAKKLQEVYKTFESGSENKLVWNEVVEFSRKRSYEFYREITKEQFEQLTSHADKKVYQNSQAIVERKLLGKLNAQNFNLKMVCGFVYQKEQVELYEFIHTNDMFIFVNTKRAFYLVDTNHTKGINLSKNQSSKKEVLDSLVSKNAMLEEKALTIKNHISGDIEKVMESYLHKISGVDFLDDLQNVDEQTNILKAMLNVNIK